MTASGTHDKGALSMMKYEEILLPQSMIPNPVEKLKFMKELPYMDGDVLLTTYSKSGTSWMGHLLGRLLKTEADAVERPCSRLLETAPPKVTLALDAPRILSTHLRPQRFPRSFFENKGKVVLLLRNPKDVAVSYYFHLKNSAMFALQQSWDEFAESFAEGNVPYGHYMDFLDEWNHMIKSSEQGKNCINVEVFYYEDLKMNGMASLRRLNEFLGCGKNDEELQDIYEACSVDKLRVEAKAEKDQIPLGQRDRDGNSVIYRKGVVGDWKNYFTVAQNEMYDTMIESRLRNSVFRFVYEA